MKKILISLFLIIIPFSFTYSQSSKTIGIFFEPVGKSFEAIRDSGLENGFVVVNSYKIKDNEMAYEFRNEKNENVSCELRFFTGINMCYAGAYILPLQAFDKIVEGFNRTGEKQGVYYHWKFPAKKYEVHISKDESKGDFLLMMSFLKPKN